MKTINTINLLTKQECDDMRSVVYELKEFWLQRSPFVPFYSLGAASYLDAAKNQQDYYAKAKHYNPILQEHFGWLYERLAHTLEQYLDAPVSYANAAALPGFHIYLSHKLFEQPLASIHCDLQYQLIKWEAPEQTNFMNPISFTLAISLPKFGSGLNLWNINYQEILEISKSDLKQFFKSRVKSFHPYQIGQMIIHSGHAVHQAAPGKDIQSEDDRITLQGHAIFSQSKWQLYW